MDTLGRKSAVLVPISNSCTYVLGLARFLFVGTTVYFALTDVRTDSTMYDVLKIACLALFSVTNGFVSTHCAIKAPMFVPENQREQIGIFVSLFLGLGIFLGSIVAIPVDSLLVTDKITNI